MTIDDSVLMKDVDKIYEQLGKPKREDLRIHQVMPYFTQLYLSSGKEQYDALNEVERNQFHRKINRAFYLFVEKYINSPVATTACASTKKVGHYE